MFHRLNSEVGFKQTEVLRDQGIAYIAFTNKKGKKIVKQGYRTVERGA